MTAREIIYDVKEIINSLTDDSDIVENWILYKFNIYREIYIKAVYAREMELRSAWMQRIFRQKTSRVTSADDPAITYSSIYVSKVSLPRPVSLPDNMGIIRIAGSSGIQPFDIIDFESMMINAMYNDTIENNMCSFIGNDCYLFPLVSEIGGLMIAFDPLQMKIQDEGVLRDMTIDDEYPVDSEIAQQAILDILTKDLGIKRQSIDDIVNDSQNQFKILQNAGLTQKSSN